MYVLLFDSRMFGQKQNFTTSTIKNVRSSLIPCRFRVTMFDLSIGGKRLAYFFENQKGSTDAKVTVKFPMRIDVRKVGLSSSAIILNLF